MNLSNVTLMAAPIMPQPSNLLVIPTCHVGVEIEVEGEGAIQSSSSNFWDIKNDGSLRNHGHELVLTQPTMGQSLINALNELPDLINSERADFSNRTSVHVHIDIRDMTVEHLFNMLFFYVYCEKAIFNYVGHDREYNNYCIPWWKTEELKYSLYTIYSSMKEDNPNQIRRTIQEHMNKYSALNLKVITHFGSIEFRHHYGTHDSDRILEWINILLSLKQQAVNIDHEHLTFEQLINEHFTIPSALEEFMTEPVTNKGMSFLNEIYHDCQLHTTQLTERENLRASSLRGALTLTHLQMLDNFNQQREVPTLRVRRTDNTEGFNEEEVSIYAGGSPILIEETLMDERRYDDIREEILSRLNTQGLYQGEAPTTQSDIRARNEQEEERVDEGAFSM
jgi:hypothetical protein